MARETPKETGGGERRRVEERGGEIRRREEQCRMPGQTARPVRIDEEMLWSTGDGEGGDGRRERSSYVELSLLSSAVSWCMAKAWKWQ